MFEVNSRFISLRPQIKPIIGGCFHGYIHQTHIPYKSPLCNNSIPHTHTHIYIESYITFGKALSNHTTSLDLNIHIDIAN